jgi:dTDP-glucose 4,6-dehydratase
MVVSAGSAPGHILLTGGTGFFGKALLRHWLANRIDQCYPQPSVTVLSRSPKAFQKSYPEFTGHDWLSVHQGDILDPNSLPCGRAFTHLLHAATDSTLGPQLTPMQRYTQIVDGTRNMLNYAAVHRIKRFLLTSSGGVYGRFPAGTTHISESYLGMSDPLDPRSAYSVAKRVSEHLCALAAHEHGLPVVVCRPFAFCGPDLPLDVHFAIGNFIRDVLWADEITVHGDGTQTRSYLDQRDLARWLLTLLEEGKSGEAYNVGSDRAISIADLAHLVRDLICPGKPVRILGANIGSPDRSHYIPDIRKIESHLGLRPTISLEQSILDTAAVAKARGKPQ